MTAGDYCTVSDIHTAMPQGPGQNSQWSAALDADLAVCITDASRAVDLYTNREPMAYNAQSDTRTFDGPLPEKFIEDGGYKYPILEIGEIADAPTVVAVAATAALVYTTWNATDYLVGPYNNPKFGYPYSYLLVDILNGGQRTWYWYRKGIQVTAPFGFSLTPPAVVKRATMIQAVRWFKRGQAAFQDTTVIVDAQQKTYQNVIDPDVCKIVDHLRRTNL